MYNISLFFNSNKDLSEISKEISKTIEINDVKVHRSTFSLSGMYYEGQYDNEFAVKVDDNNYDYEEMYKYFINIRNSKVYMRGDLLSIAREVAYEIALHLKFEVAIELSLRVDTEFDLEVYTFNGSKVVSLIKHFTQ